MQRGAGGLLEGRLRKFVSRVERQAGGRIREEDGKHSRKGGRMWAEPLTEERMESFISASAGGSQETHSLTVGLMMWKEKQ